MNILIAALVRSVVIGALLAAYTLALPVLFRDTGDGVSIGAGLLAFAGLALIAAGWGLWDGRRRDFARVLGTWGIVGAVVAVVGLATRVVIEADDSLGIPGSRTSPEGRQRRRRTHRPDGRQALSRERIGDRDAIPYGTGRAREALDAAFMPG